MRPDLHGYGRPDDAPPLELASVRLETPPPAVPEPAVVAASPAADTLRALALAALVLSTVEMSYAWAERWFHGPAYLALSAALTLGSALALGLLGGLVRLPLAATLALWVGGALGLAWGWPEGVAAGLVTVLALRTPCARASAPSLLGTVAALGLAAAFLKDSSLAEHLGHKDERVYESVGGLLVLGLVLGLVPILLRLLPGRLTPRTRVLALVVLGCLASLRPRLERGDGGHRKPPPGYAASTPRAAGEGAPDVFLLVLDTVRADHLSVYGYGRETTPELARWMRERPNAVAFPQAVSNGTWTVPSHASLFTGRLPSEHGAHFSLTGSVRVGFGIGESLPTLAGELRHGGYATLAGYANHWLRSVQGMGRGFDRYLRAPDKDELPFIGETLRQRFLPGLLWEAAKGCARAEDVNATVLSMVEPWSEGPNPLFVFANYVDAHGPYAPPEPFRGTFAPSSLEERSEHLSGAQPPARHEELMARYDEEILYLDHRLGELFARLDALGILGSSWVFVTADHREAFGEHAVLEHGTTVHAEVTHVPLIVFPPDGVRMPVTDAPVSLVDVAATIAAIGGAALPGPGRDLRALDGAGTSATALEFYGDPVKAANLGALARRPARAVLMGRHKLIAYEGEFELYNLELDPGEHVNLATAQPALVEHLKAFLPEFGVPTFTSDRDAPVPEALDALRGLGYIGGVQ